MVVEHHQRVRRLDPPRARVGGELKAAGTTATSTTAIAITTTTTNRTASATATRTASTARTAKTATNKEKNSKNHSNTHNNNDVRIHINLNNHNHNLSFFLAGRRRRIRLGPPRRANVGRYRPGRSRRWEGRLHHTDEPYRDSQHQSRRGHDRHRVGSQVGCRATLVLQTPRRPLSKRSGSISRKVLFFI